MRKSMIRIAAIALAVVMLTTCAITSIVAGYVVTAEEKTVTATVSGFGVQVATTVAQTGDAALTLVPGGSGTLATVTVTGTPSVNAVLDVTAAITTSIAAGKIFITVNGTTVAQVADEDYYAVTVPNAIAAAADALSFTAGTEITANNTVVIGWTWTAGDGDNNVADGATLQLTVNATVSQA